VREVALCIAGIEPERRSDVTWAEGALVPITRMTKANDRDLVIGWSPAFSYRQKLIVPGNEWKIL
jgi:hypothetical protein